MGEGIKHIHPFLFFFLVSRSFLHSTNHEEAPLQVVGLKLGPGDMAISMIDMGPEIRGLSLKLGTDKQKDNYYIVWKAL
jgi:hypothetical protein